MLSKKLWTLACVVGILAFGGCIFIPSGPAPPPAPPRVEFNGIQMIEVVVTNASESKHLDPENLAAAVVKEINEEAKSTTMKAEIQRDGAAGDAVLKIAVQSETVVPAPSAKTATYQLKISSTLTKADGKIVWSEHEGVYPAFVSSVHDPQDLWDSPKIRREVVSTVGSNLVIRMFYVK